MNKNTNVILWGLPASGKSQVGRRLSQALGKGFLDLDDLIELREGRSIASIIRDDGLDKFREIEKKYLAEVLPILNHVVSIGGGTLQSDDSVSALEGLGLTVYLETGAHTLAQRVYMKPDEIRKRPLLHEALSIEDKAERFDRLVSLFQVMLDSRERLYRKANVIVSDGKETPEDTAQRIFQILVKKEYDLT